MNVVDRFLQYVDKDTADGCWLWTGHKSKRGYGYFGITASPGIHANTRAHRAAYELFVGPIPDGLVIDHLCRVTSCVNPAHLEPVTDRENSLRGEHPNYVTCRTNICPQGHSMADAYRDGPGKRRCRPCRIAARKRAVERVA